MDKPNLDGYYEACRQAALHSEKFAEFRSWRSIQGVTDTNTREHGLECEQEIMVYHRYLLPLLDTFRRVDWLGMPPLHRFTSVGLFNPTTLRHIVTLARIKKWVNRPIQTVIEIGGGYGNLAALLWLSEPIVYYDMYEPMPVYSLAGEFFTQLTGGFNPLRFNDPYNIPSPDLGVDLLISCYALSELDETDQEWYLTEVIPKARTGFLVMNSCKNGYPRETMIARLQAELDTEIICEREIPATHKDNYTLKWKRGNDGQ